MQDLQYGQVRCAQRAVVSLTSTIMFVICCRIEISHSNNSCVHFMMQLLCGIIVHVHCQGRVMNVGSITCLGSKPIAWQHVKTIAW